MASPLAILTAPTLRTVFRRALRQTGRLIGFIIGLPGLALRMPDNTTLRRRAATLQVPWPQCQPDTEVGHDAEPLQVLVNGTGLKLRGAGKWLLERHATQTRLSWGKQHLGVDAHNGQTVATALTTNEVAGGSQVCPCNAAPGARSLRDPARTRILFANDLEERNDAHRVDARVVTMQLGSGIDCDIHPAVPNLQALLPYLDDPWREIVVLRGLDDLNSISYPPNAPVSCRPDWRVEGVKPGADFARLLRDALDHFGTGIAIANCLYAVQALFSEDLAAAMARAVNTWMAKEYLDRDPRLRASIVIATQNVEHAVDEIERCAQDPRFVQVLVLASGDAPLGKRHLWPIYAIAERHGLPIGIHAGSSYHHAPGPTGWPSFYTEDYVNQVQAFHSQLSSLICEGVFNRFPSLKVVLLESGVTWLPAHLWRLTKYWRGLRIEIPWVDRSPTEIVRSNVRLSVQPIDGPGDTQSLLRILDHFKSDEMLLFATDYPHWNFDGDAALPDGLDAGLVRKIRFDNPLTTYQRLNGG